jgi:hypothetical protein
VNPAIEPRFQVEHHWRGVTDADRSATPALDNMKALTAKQRWAAICAFAVLATAATFTFIGDPFGYFSVCDRCGALRRTTEWKLPLSEFTVFTRSVESETPLSRAVLTNGIVQPHTHHWLFGHGGGHGVKCAIGQGRHIRPAADSQEFARLVLMLHTHGLPALRDRVLRGAFDPDTSQLFFGLSFSAPKEPTTPAEMQSWFSEQSEYLDEKIAVYKER